jgi:transposase InsO family protein
MKSRDSQNAASPSVVRQSSIVTASYQNHYQRAAALGPWLEYYNIKRPHSALGHKPPATRITQTD